MKLSTKININSTHNPRDLGGIVSSDGRSIKPKMIIRSSFLHKLSDEDIKVLSDEYHLKYDIDLRWEGEIEENPDKEIPGCKYINLNLHDDYKFRDEHRYQIPEDRKWLLEREKNFDGFFFYDKDGDVVKGTPNMYRGVVINPESHIIFNKILNLLKDLKDGSLLYHCYDGKDRTGIITMIILLALGVDFDTIREDYLLTGYYMKNRILHEKEKYQDIDLYKLDPVMGYSKFVATDAYPTWIESAYNAIFENYETLDNFFTNHVKFSKEDIQKLRDNCLE